MNELSPSQNPESARAEADAVALDRAHTQIASMRASLSMLTATSAQIAGALEQRNQEHTTLVARQGELQRRIDALRTELDLATNERAAYKGQVDDRNAQLVDLHTRLEHLQAELEASNAAGQDLEARLAQVQATLDGRDADVAGLQRDLTQVQSRLDGKQAELAALVVAKAALDEQYAEAQTSLESRSAEIDMLKGRLADLTTLQQSTENARVDAEARAQTGQAELDEIDQALSALLSDTQAALPPGPVAAVDESSGEQPAAGVLEAPQGRAASVNALVASVGALIMQGESKDASLAAATTQIASLDEQVNSLTADKGDLQAATQKQGEALAALQSEVDGLNGKISELQARLRVAEQFEEASGLAGLLSNMPVWKRNAATAAILLGVHPQMTDRLQGLSRIKGIGRAPRRRLYNAGLGTYWELSSLTDDELHELMALPPVQRDRTNLAEVRALAYGLAQETGTVGHIWCGENVDDFEGMGGIGRVFEERLYEAGISTYEQLAASSVEQLAEICRAPGMSKPDYPAWIASARQLVHARLAAAAEATAAAEVPPEPAAAAPEADATEVATIEALAVEVAGEPPASPPAPGPSEAA